MPRPNEEEVLVVAAEAGHGSEQSNHDSGSGGESCHFHAGIEHCVGAGESESEDGAGPRCNLVTRSYNVPLRIGTLFVILATSSIAVYGPILLKQFSKLRMNGFTFTIIKQFGTGVIFTTAFIHLATHAQLYFANECLGRLTYEATSTAILMAGAFLAFLVEYCGHRLVLHRKSPMNSDLKPERNEGENALGQPALVESRGASHSYGLEALGHHHDGLSQPDSKLSVFVMEAGIIFHSIIIGVTLVVAGDSGFISLFIVIIFHQMFEGLALGARIAAVQHISMGLKLLLALAFALTTPIGMAIGLGVLKSFNGNDKGTIIAIGTLDAVSAGILAWVAIVDMWGHDWLHGELKDSGLLKTIVAMVALLAGMVLMGLLGKWA
ncbi:MAG: hypothetical protein Q9217_004096 [Psora testacea]